MANILLIDDDAVLLKLYSTRLRSDGHLVETAMNGQEGLEKLAVFHPHIIVLDLLMPKINGFTFLETLNKSPYYAALPKIVFSSIASDEQIDRLKALKVSTYLNKSETTPTQLVNIINEQLKANPIIPQ